MIDEKKLIEELEEWKSELNADYVLIDKAVCDVLNKVEDIINDQSQVGGWIPVSERPPKETGNYLVTSKGSTWVANWFNGTWWGIEKKCRWTDVEAWQPLPEPYKESEEE